MRALFCASTPSSRLSAPAEPTGFWVAMVTVPCTPARCCSSGRACRRGSPDHRLQRLALEIEAGLAGAGQRRRRRAGRGLVDRRARATADHRLRAGIAHGFRQGIGADAASLGARCSARCICGEGKLEHAASRPSTTVGKEGTDVHSRQLHVMASAAACWMRARCCRSDRAQLRAGLLMFADRLDPRFLVPGGSSAAAIAVQAAAVAMRWPPAGWRRHRRCAAGRRAGIAEGAQVELLAAGAFEDGAPRLHLPPTASRPRLPATLPTCTRCASPPPWVAASASRTCGLISTPVRMKSSDWLCAVPSPSGAVARKLRGRRSWVNSGAPPPRRIAPAGRSGPASPAWVAATRLRPSPASPLPPVRPCPAARRSSSSAQPANDRQQPGQWSAWSKRCSNERSSHAAPRRSSPPAPGAGSRTGQTDVQPAFLRQGCCRGWQMRCAATLTTSTNRYGRADSSTCSTPRVFRVAAAQATCTVTRR